MCGAVVNKTGGCSTECYPYGKDQCNGYNWDSKEPICAYGLTFTNLAEAACEGTPRKKIEPVCYQRGICVYGTRNGKNVTVFKTPKGRGESVKSAATNTAPVPHTGARYSYSEAMTKVLLFYDSQISGRFESIHKRLKWRKNSCKECVDKRYKKDLSGGFYEAGGSYLKFAVINAYMAAMLSWSAIEEKSAMAKAGVLNDVRFKVKWASDYLIQCHLDTYVFTGLQGNDTLDFDYFGPPELYYKYVKDRPVGYITKSLKGSEILADSAAALASASILLKDKVQWSKSALARAEHLYQWAYTYLGSYMDNPDPVMELHSSLYSANPNGPSDSLAWAAIWLYKATGKAKYLNDTKKWYAKTKFNTDADTFEMNNHRPAISVLLAASVDKKYRKDAEAFLNSYLTQKVVHTDRGMAYPYHWGAARFPGNVAWLAFVYAKNSFVPTKYANRLRNYGQFQVNYLLGDSGRSWIVGFGDSNIKDAYVWHKASYNSILDWNPKVMAVKIKAMPRVGPWSSTLKQPQMQFVEKGKLDMEGSATPQRRVVYGSIVTPLLNDNMVASRKDYTYTEWTLEYPACLVGALAHLSGWYKQGPYTGSMVDVKPFKA